MRSHFTPQISILTGFFLLGIAALPSTASAQTETDNRADRPATVEVVPQTITPIVNGTIKLQPPTQVERINPRVRRRLKPPVTRQSRGLTAIDVVERPQRGGALRSSSVQGTSWTRLNVPVCWENLGEWNAKGRAWVEDAIENSWDKSTDLDFTDWGQCEADSKGIRIAVREAGPHVAELGRNLDGLKDGMILNFSFQAWGTSCALNESNREFCIRSLAVHEFGHALGLAHEDLRNDAAVERDLCFAEAQGPNATFYITDYDPNSVMNYCSPSWNNNGRLTALDVAGARMIYGPFNEDTPATAEANLSVAFARADGSYARPAPVAMTFTLTADTPSQTQVHTFCSDGDRLLETRVMAGVRPGSTRIYFSTQFELYAASNGCATKGSRVAIERTSQQLTEPSLRLVSNTATLSPDQVALQHAEVTLTSRRTLGNETVAQDCESCIAAAAEAVFSEISSETHAAVKNWGPGLSNRALAIVIAARGLWRSPNISVCWEGPYPIAGLSSDTVKAREWTKTAVEDTWEAVSDVDFTGWGECDNQTRTHHDIRIQVLDDGPKVEAVGRQLSGMPGGMKLNFTFQEWGQGCAPYKEFCIKALAVHEFGHALGFAHEHNRVDRTVCDREGQGPPPAYLVTKYDLNSVMNYCSADWNNNGRLSTLDVVGVRSLYGPFDEDMPMGIRQSGGVQFASPVDGTSHFEAVSYDAALTADNGTTEKDFWVCNGDDLLIHISSKMELRRGEMLASSQNAYKLYATENCETSSNLISEVNDFGSVALPGDSVEPASLDLQERIGDDVIRSVTVYLTPKRILGEALSDTECESCAAAAQDARFGPETAPLSLLNTSLHPESFAASPWPSDFNLDLDVCVREARAGPPFGNAPWSEAKLQKLCKATPTSKEPAKCFGRIMTDDSNFGERRVGGPENALNLCAGSENASLTLACFSDKINAGSSSQATMLACATP